MLISPAYRDQNRLLHASNPAYGVSGQMWSGYVANLISTEGYMTVLDYGCGKGTLKACLEKASDRPPFLFAEYDPAIEGKDAEPEPAELVVCTDVLEHIEPAHLNAVLRHLASKTQRKLFCNVSIQQSTKTLDDGRNAHLIVKPAEWWRDRLAKFFRIVFWQEQPTYGLVYCELAPRRGPRVRPVARRPMHPEWAAMIEQIRAQNHKYSDAWGRLNSFNMWEGIGDKIADMQVVMNVLETCEDVDVEMRTIVAHAQKAVMALVPITRDMPEKYWRRLFEKFLRIGDWHIDQLGEHTRLAVVGAPMVGVMGVTAIGAVASEDRWEQVKANSELVKGRIEAAPAHTRRAILACYGPSLVDTLDVIREEREATGAAVISVSGAHDMLIAAGIVPDYHVECDPRPHKTDNMEAAHPGVQYLIASGVHPNYFDKLTGHDVRLWHISTAEHSMRIIDELGEHADCLISGGGSVGLRAIPLLYAMGYRDFSIYAMDCSFRSDGETVQQWAGKHAGKKQDVCEVECAGRLFISSPVLLTYATGFFETIQRVTDVTFRLFGDGLLQSMCRMYQNIPQVRAVIPGDNENALQREHQKADCEHSALEDQPGEGFGDRRDDERHGDGQSHLG